MKRCTCLCLAAVFSALPMAVSAAGTGLIFISNEKSSTITVLKDDEVISSFDTCARPRGMHFTADRSGFFVGCADDSVIAIYEVATQRLIGRIRNVAEPETFDLHPDGKRL